MTLAIEKKWPVYAPLKLDFDRDRMREELLKTEPHWRPLAPGKRTVKDIPHFRVADPIMYEQAEYLDQVDDKTVYVTGEPTWKGIALRHVPDVPGSHVSSAKFMMDNFLKYDDWIWDETFDIPYIREIVEALPYECLEVTRIMAIDPGGFGPTHRDSKTDRMWEEGGLTSTTFTIDYGGAHMRVEHNNQIFETDAPAFFFKDSSPHGVPPVTSRRMILRMHGKADFDRYQALLDLDRAIW